MSQIKKIQTQNNTNTKKRQNQTQVCITQATHPLTAHVEVRVCHSASPLSSMERMGRVQDSESDDAQDDESENAQDDESDDSDKG